MNGRSWIRRAGLAAVVTVSGYAFSGELYYRGDRLSVDAWGDCRAAPTDLVPWALALVVLTFLSSSAYFARLTDGRWWLRTVSLSLGSAALGLIAGRAWYVWRMQEGAECLPRGEWCLGSCDPLWWDQDVVRLPLLFAIAAGLSVLVGAAARRIPPRRRG